MRRHRLEPEFEHLCPKCDTKFDCEAPYPIGACDCICPLCDLNRELDEVAFDDSALLCAMVEDEAEASRHEVMARLLDRLDEINRG